MKAATEMLYDACTLFNLLLLDINKTIPRPFPNTNSLSWDADIFSPGSDFFQLN